MKIAYFDCFSGAAGDMIVAALLDAGAPFDALRKQLKSLPIEGYELKAQQVRKQGFAATRFEVLVDPDADKPHRHLKDIERIINASGLSQQAKARSIEIFRRLAEAEARAHGTAPGNVHFHEVGAIDAIVDVAAAVICLEQLEIERVFCSAVAVGSGTVRCEHGLMPVPAPGTAALLEGVPIAECDEPGELLTPTGAAVLTTLAERFGPIPPMTLEATGYGAGAREGHKRPNLLRVLLGQTNPIGETDEITVLEANLDDATGQVLAAAVEKLLAAGALDAFCTPITMKKGRPAVMITVLAEPAHADNLQEVLFRETPTFGVRRYSARRRKLRRDWQSVETAYGPVRIKTGVRNGQVVSATPEYEDCVEAAERAGVSVREVIAAALAVWHSRHRPA